MQHRSRKRFALGALSMALVGGSVAMTVGAPPASAAPVTLTFLNINDFHGRIDENTVAFAATVEQARLDAPGPVALLAAGDLVGGSLFASAIQQDQPAIDVLNALDLDASAVGNHEFDQGFADLRDRIIGNPADPNADWAYLGANVYLDGTQTPAMQEYAIIDMGTMSVGVIGAVTAETPSLVSPEGIATLDFGDPVDAVNRVAVQLSDGNAANGEADVIVAEYHEGAPFGDTSGTPLTLAQNVAASEAFDRIVNVTSANVDVIFNGHTHQEYEYFGQIPGAPVGQTRPIVSTGEYGNKIAKVTLTVDDVSNTVTTTSTTAVNITRFLNAPATPPSSVPVVTPAQLAYPRVVAVKNIVDAARTFANEKGAVPVGALSDDITTAYTGGTYTGPGNTLVGGTTGDRSKESTLGNLVADALRDRLSAPERGGADIGVVNPGGLRADLLFNPDGTITTAEALAVLPFGNDLRTTTLTGAQFKTLLEQQWQRTSGGAIPMRPYLQLGLSDNVTYTFDESRAEGDRITSITVNGIPVTPSADYRIGTFSFLATGGDNFRIFTQGTNTQDSGLIDRDAWISYLNDRAPVCADFARQALVSGNLPTAVTAGTNLTFNVSGFDLTSLGSPLNTSADVYVGGVKVGTTPITSGAAAINLPVPATVPSGNQPLQVIAQPSGTALTVAVLVAGGAANVPYDPIEVVADDCPVNTPPSRLADSRDGKGFAKAPLVQGIEYKLKVAGVAGVPPNAKAVAVNVTALNSTVDGYINVYPCGGTFNPTASVVNQVPGKIVANLAMVDVGVDGSICFVTNTPTDVVVDLQTFYPASSDLETLTPVRLVDSRSGLGLPSRIPSNIPVELKVTGVNGVPADASAVVVNLTSTDSPASFITAYPCGTPPPTASNLNTWIGHAIANLAVVKVGTDGKICFRSSDAAHLVVDLQGYFVAGADYQGFTPVRALDTRVTNNPLQSNVFRELKIAGEFGVPLDADQVTVNVTAVNSVSDQFITVYPCGPLPVVSSGNTSPDRIVATLAVVNLSAAGSICVLSNDNTDLVIDVQGWTS